MVSMSDYVVTNIRLLEEDYLRLKNEAAAKRKSLSAIIREKVGKPKISGEEYRKKLLSIKGTWDLEPEIRKGRDQIEKRLKKLWNE